MIEGRYLRIGDLFRECIFGINVIIKGWVRNKREGKNIAFLEINTSIHETYWTVSYKVPFDLIRKYIPEYRYRDGMKIRTNFYKCGDYTEYPHYGVWNPIPLEKPDFHQPDYFGEVVLG